MLVNFKKEGNVILGYLSDINRARILYTSEIIKVKYDVNIENVPDSICAIPLLGLIIPIALLTGEKIGVKCIDRDYFESIHKYNKYMTEEYSSLTEIPLYVESVEKNLIVNRNGAGLLFSGGVDSTYMLFKHLNNFPRVITLIGPGPFSIKKDSHKINKTIHYIKRLAHDLNLKHHIISYSEFLDGEYLDSIAFFKLHGNPYWGGLGIGITLPSLIAPLAYKLSLNNIYVASGMPFWLKWPWADRSDVYNIINFAGVKVVSDDFEVSRLEKLKRIISYAKESNLLHKIEFLVCTEPGRVNCGVCEKCQRTIAELLAIDEDPIKWGFKKGTLLYDRLRIADLIDLYYWKEVQLRKPQLIPFNLVRITETNRHVKTAIKASTIVLLKKLKMYHIFGPYIKTLLRRRRAKGFQHHHE